MDESEQALLNAANTTSRRVARIVKHIIGDPKSHRLWEARHAELVRPVAEQGRRTPQVIALRGIEVSLVHRRALIDHIRENKVTGTVRDHLFSTFYGPRDLSDAIVAEHKQYMLAESSRVSTDHLIGVMCDPISNRLVKLYKASYAEYFDLYCYVSACEDSASADAARLLMLDARRRTRELRKRLEAERPDNRYADFDRQALLARSGRYPVLDYMVG
jgi:hypothetical protein